MVSYPYTLRFITVPLLDEIIKEQRRKGGYWRKPTKQVIAGLPQEARLPVSMTMMIDDGVAVRCMVGYDQVGHAFWLDIPIKLWKSVPQATVEASASA